MFDSPLPPGVIVAATQAQQTERALTALIALLLVIAAMLALLTLWYWRHTSPRRRMERMYVADDEVSYVYETGQTIGYVEGQEILPGERYADH